MMAAVASLERRRGTMATMTDSSMRRSQIMFPIRPDEDDAEPRLWMNNDSELELLQLVLNPRTRREVDDARAAADRVVSDHGITKLPHFGTRQRYEQEVELAHKLVDQLGWTLTDEEATPMNALDANAARFPEWIKRRLG
jgi:hypothetical protein